jgi:hypothetical protein
VIELVSITEKLKLQKCDKLKKNKKGEETMKKKIILLSLGILVLGLVGCQTNKKDVTKNNKDIVTLTKNEKELANGNPNIGAQLLVRKAVLNEMKQADISDKEKFELEFIKDNIAINYYLEKMLDKNIQITEATIQQVYEENKDKFPDKSLEEVHDQIEQLLLEQMKNEKLITYYNQLVDKYKLNDALKNEFPSNVKIGK